MKIRELIVTQFKNYTYQVVQFEAGINLLYGSNGSGKTNILDAIHCLALTKSHFLSQDKLMIKHSGDFYRLEGRFVQDHQALHVILKYHQGIKKLEVNDRIITKNADHIGSIGIVFIAPDDLDIIDGLSAVRRKFIDITLSQSDKTYLRHSTTYKKILEQRNSYLKLTDHPDKLYLQILDEKLEEAGNYIYKARVNFCAEFALLFDAYYKDISNNKEQVYITYDTSLHELTMAELLASSIDNDIRLRTTTKGIHKDDLKFGIDQHEVRHVASQGQKKTFLVSLFLAQADFLSHAMQHMPLLILDDVFDKLDPQRMEYLLSTLQKKPGRQILLTDTSKDRIQSILKGLSGPTHFMHVKDGLVTSNK